HPLLEGFERFKDFLQLKIGARFFRPKCRRYRAIRAEHDDQSLSWPRGTGQAEARQTNKKWQGRCRDAELFEKLTTMPGIHERSAPKMRTRSGDVKTSFRCVLAAHGARTALSAINLLKTIEHSRTRLPALPQMPRFARQSSTAPV